MHAGHVGHHGIYPLLPARDDYPERYAAALSEVTRRDLAALRALLAAWRCLAPTPPTPGAG